MGLHLALWNQFRKVAVYRTPIDPLIQDFASGLCEEKSSEIGPTQEFFMLYETRIRETCWYDGAMMARRAEP